MCDFIILIMNDTIHFEPRFFFLLNLYECICPYANFNYGPSGQSEWFHIYGILLKQLPSRFPEFKDFKWALFWKWFGATSKQLCQPHLQTRAFSSGPSVSERLQNEPCSIVVACPGPRGKGGLLRLQGWKVAGNCQTTNPHSAIQTNKRYIPASKKGEERKRKKMMIFSKRTHLEKGLSCCFKHVTHKNTLEYTQIQDNHNKKKDGFSQPVGKHLWNIFPQRWSKIMVLPVNKL